MLSSRMIPTFPQMELPDWKPQDIRDMAHSLIRLANTMDGSHEGPNARADLRWSGAMSRIEKNAPHLAAIAREVYHKRRKRQQFIPAQLLGEPAWDILLELFIQFTDGTKVSTTSLCIAADVPSTTALRHIDLLADAGLVQRLASSFDKRVTYIELTDTGVIAVGNYLRQC